MGRAQRADRRRPGRRHGARQGRARAKTIVDGLDALARGLDGEADAAAAGAAAGAAMDEVLAAFRDRPSAMGRARMFAEKSIGLDDPGMLALAEVVRAVADMRDGR